MVPSVIGSSYCLPVRLSVIVSVSAIARIGLFRFRVGVGHRLRLGRRAVLAGGPSGQILVPATFAAEWPPPPIHGTITTPHAPLRLAHPSNHNSLWAGPWALDALGGDRWRLFDGRRPVV